jgi:hypothetical protein
LNHKACKQNDLTLSILISGSREAVISLFYTRDYSDIYSAVSILETIDIAVSVKFSNIEELIKLRNIAKLINPKIK